MFCARAVDEESLGTVILFNTCAWLSISALGIVIPSKFNGEAKHCPDGM